MKKLILISFIILGISQIGFAQFNLKHGRVYKEASFLGIRDSNGRPIVNITTDSMVLSKIRPDSFIIRYANPHLIDYVDYPGNLVELTTDSITGNVFFKQKLRNGTMVANRPLYLFPNHNNIFIIHSPWNIPETIYARVVNRRNIILNNNTFAAVDVNIYLIDTLQPVNGNTSWSTTWIKGVGAIGGFGGFLNLHYFGILGGWDSLLTRPLCISNPLDTSDINYVNPMFNTCFLRISGINKTISQESMAYPNPTYGRFKLRGYKEKEGLTLRIFSNSGKEVWRGIPSPEGEIDISQLSPGLYHVEALTTSGKRWFTRVARE